MKQFFILVLTALFFSGCYVSYPSVGVRPARIQYVEKCTYSHYTNSWVCQRIRRWHRVR